MHGQVLSCLRDVPNFSVTRTKTSQGENLDRYVLATIRDCGGFRRQHHLYWV